MTSPKSTSCWTVIIFVHFVTQVCLQGVTFGENNYPRSLTSLRWGLTASPLALYSAWGNNSVASYREQGRRRSLPKVSWLTILLVLGVLVRETRTTSGAYRVFCHPYVYADAVAIDVRCICLCICIQDLAVTLFAFLSATTVATIACRFNFDKGPGRFRKHLPLTRPLQIDEGHCSVAAQAAPAQVDFAPTCGGRSAVFAAGGRKIAHPERTYLIESHREWLSELEYGSYFGVYTHGQLLRRSV